MPRICPDRFVGTLNTYKTIGGLIQAGRQAKNFTLGHIAAKMGIAASVASSWEDGSVHPNDWQLNRLAKVLG